MLYDPRAPFSSSLPARFGTDWEPVFPPLDGPSSRRDPDFWREAAEAARGRSASAPSALNELVRSIEADKGRNCQTVRARARNDDRPVKRYLSLTDHEKDWSTDDRPPDGVMREDWLLDGEYALFTPALDERWQREASRIVDRYMTWRVARSLWLPKGEFPLACELLLEHQSVALVAPHRELRGMRLCLKRLNRDGVVVNAALIYRSPPNES